MRKRTVKRAAPLAALVMLAVACGDDGGGNTATTTPATTAAATTAAPATTGAPVTTAGTVSLKAAGCPDPLVIQTDWFPEAEHGGTYQLIGPDGTQDPKNGRYSGPLGDITLEIRAGGPFLGTDSPTQQMYKNPEVFMSYIDTGDAIKSAGKLPVVAVFAALEKGPQILMWDPAKFPDVKTIVDIGKTAEDGTILYFSGGAYMDYLIGKGLLKQSQVDASYDGSPTRFVSTEGVFQQGFVTNEVYLYENDIPEWKKPVGWALVHDTGFAIYQSALSREARDHRHEVGLPEGTRPPDAAGAGRLRQEPRGHQRVPHEVRDGHGPVLEAE